MVRRFTLIIICSLLYLCTAAYGAGISASVDQNPVALGQSFHLIIDLQSQHLATTPDISQLAPNFQVLGMSRNQRMSIVNGNISRQNQLVISLVPRQMGKMIIPAIKIGNEQTQPISIEVKGSHQIEIGRNQAIFLQAEVDNKTPYIQSEVIYTVKLYYNQAMSNSSLTPPVAENAMIKKLGRDLTYRAHYKGKLYHVFQRSFAIFPQKSGKLIIVPPILRAEVDTGDRYSNPLNGGLFSLNTQPIELVAPKINMQVKSKPAAAKGQWWLPARNISLKQSWSQDRKQVRSGEPITRMVTITAEGLTAAQLPKLKLSGDNQTNSYPSPAKLDDKLINHHFVGSRTEKIVYIPTQTGPLRFPAMQINWWNTRTNTMEVAMLPAQQLTVLAASGTQQVAPPPVPPSAPATVAAKMPTKAVEKAETTITTATDYYLTGLVILLLCFMLILVSFFFKRRKKLSGDKHESTTHNIFELMQIKKQLKQACMGSAAKKVKSLLIQWAQAKWHEKTIRSLGDVHSLNLPDDLAQAIKQLEKHLYTSVAEATWDGPEFWGIFKGAKLAMKEPNKKHEAVLPELYLK